MIVFNAAIVLCRIAEVKNNVFPSLGNKLLCRNTEYRGARFFLRKSVHFGWIREHGLWRCWIREVRL